MEMLWYVVEAGLLVIAFAIAANRLLKIGCVLRERATLLSDALLADDRFPIELKSEINSIIPHLADYVAAWHVVLAVMLMPFVRFGRDSNPEVPADLVRPWRDVQRASILAALTNSLTALGVFIILMMVTTYFVAFNRIADGVMRKLTSSSNLGAGGWDNSGLNAAR